MLPDIRAWPCLMRKYSLGMMQTYTAVLGGFKHLDALSCVGFIFPVITELTIVNCTFISLFFRNSFRCHVNRIIPKKKSLKLQVFLDLIQLSSWVISRNFPSAPYFINIQRSVTTRYTDMFNIKTSVFFPTRNIPRICIRCNSDNKHHYFPMLYIPFVLSSRSTLCSL
jgi:hypothetical protein